MNKFTSPTACKIVSVLFWINYSIGCLCLCAAFFATNMAAFLLGMGISLIVSGAFLNLMVIVASRLDWIYQALMEMGRLQFGTKNKE